MAQSPTTFTDELAIALANLRDAASGTLTPSLRLGVTGLSRAGKTVFITALVHDLLTSGRLPGFAPLTEGRYLGAQLAEYPEAGIPRFAYEQHLATLSDRKPDWPDSTRRISQLRLTLKFQSKRWLAGMGGPSTVNLDIVDYPGEWLLDLPLLNLSFAEWSAQTFALLRREPVGSAAGAFLEAVDALDVNSPASDLAAEHLAGLYTQFLRQAREAETVTTLPPGRFLLPGDLEGSPALTFAPLPDAGGPVRSDTLHAMLERRFEAYKSVVVRPFFRDHFARLDRQVVLVDVLRAVNGGPAALADLETALTSVLSCFRQGESGPLNRILSRRIDRILFAATKGDHIHHTSHDRLEAILSRLLANAGRRARYAGARTETLAIAALRATREGEIKQAKDLLPCIIGTPIKGERLGDATYDGKTEVALFPGDLPADPDTLFSGERAEINFLRFAPPKLERDGSGAVVLPAIRFDRALDYLIGDWLR